MEKAALLDAIAKKVQVCQRCDLWKGTKHAVPGSGNPEAKIAFIGEAPGFYEDQQGLPFVGAAGKLLDQVLKEIGLARENVFIGNVVKHRPPENRDPQPAEIAACSLWLDQQLEVIKPAVVVTLGRFSLARYLNNAKISSIHGKPVRVGGLIILPMFHPAAALRSSAVMQEFKKDFINNKDLLLNPEEMRFSLGEEDTDEDQLGLFN